MTTACLGLCLGLWVSLSLLLFALKRGREEETPQPWPVEVQLGGPPSQEEQVPGVRTVDG